MRGSFLGDIRVFGLSSGVPGGVVNRVFETFLDLFSEGELNESQ